MTLQEAQEQVRWQLAELKFQQAMSTEMWGRPSPDFEATINLLNFIAEQLFRLEELES